MRLTSVNLIFSFRLGTWTNGVATFAGVTTPLQCLIKNYNDPGDVASLDISALCDVDEVNIPGRGSGTITFDAMVPLAGRLFKDAKGKPIELTVKEVSTVTLPLIRAGFVSGVAHKVDSGGLQMESVSIRLGVPVAAVV